MNVRILHCVALIGLSCLIASTTMGCHRSGSQDSGTAQSAQAAVEVGGGSVQTKSRGQGNVAAIFIGNRLGEKYNDKKLQLQDLVVAESNAVGYSCLTQENALESITPSDMDRLMKSESSRLAMARNLGADYFIAVNLTRYDEAVVEKSAYGVKVERTDYTLTLTYQVADRNLGGTLDSGKVTVTTSQGKTAALSTSSDPLNDLLERGATELAAKFKKDLPPPPPLGKTRFFVDMHVQSFTVPNITQNAKGDYVVSSESLPILAQTVAVFLDGASSGTTPCRLQGPMGLHKMRLACDGCRGWEGDVAIAEGVEFVINLQLTDEKIQQFKQMADFLAAMKKNEKIADAEVEAIKGFAQTLRQSGFKVDVKADINSKDLKAINMISKCFWSSEK